MTPGTPQGSPSPFVISVPIPARCCPCPGAPRGFLLRSFPHRLHPSRNGLSAPGKSITSEQRLVERPGQTHRRGSGKAVPKAPSPAIASSPRVLPGAIHQQRPRCCPEEE